MGYKYGFHYILLIAIAIIYLPFLGNDFVFDDVHSVSDIVLDFFAAPRLAPRWFPQATLGWTADVFSNAVPHFFHLGNIVLHAINTLLLFHLSRQLLILAKGAEVVSAEWLNIRAFSVALIFACHPVAVYAVGYISQRSLLMATLFGLIMQITYLQGFVTGKKCWLPISLFAYFTAIFCKEHSIMLPAILIGLSVLFYRRNQLNFPILALIYLGYVATAILLLLKIKGIIGNSYEPLAIDALGQQQIADADQNVHILSILTQSGLFFKYLLLWVMPNPEWMSIDMRATLVPAILSWQSFVSAAAFLTYGMLALFLLFNPSRFGLWGFALIYPWLLFFVEFSTVRVQEPFVLYRSYIWMAGGVITLPLAFSYLKNKYFMWVITFIALTLTVISWNRLSTFTTNYTLWDDAAKLVTVSTPGADRIFFNRGQAAAKLRIWNTAEGDLKLSTIINPTVSIARYELGMVYLNRGKNIEALQEFDVGIKLSPEDGSLYLGRGLALLRLGKKKEGQDSINKACELNDGTACLLATTNNQKNLTN